MCLPETGACAMYIIYFKADTQVVAKAMAVQAEDTDEDRLKAYVKGLQGIK